MKKSLLLITALMSLFTFGANAANYYLAGEFNNWQAGDKNYQFVQSGDEHSFSLDFPGGVLEGEFKVTSDTWDLSWGSYNTVYPNEWISLTSVGYNNIKVYEGGKIENATISIFMSDYSSALCVTGDYIAPNLGHGIQTNAYASSGAWEILPLTEKDGQRGVFTGKYNLSNTGWFRIVEYNVDTKEVLRVYGAPEVGGLNFNLGQPSSCVYGGKDYSIGAGEYDFTFSAPYIVVTDADHPAQDFYTIYEGWYGADYTYFMPYILNMNLPQDIEYAIYIKTNEGDFEEYPLYYQGYGVGYVTENIQLQPKTNYLFTIYITGTSGGSTIYNSGEATFQFTTNAPSFGFNFFQENVTRHGATLVYSINSNIYFTEAEYEIEYICSNPNGDVPDVIGRFNTEPMTGWYTQGEYLITGLEPDTYYEIRLNITQKTEYGTTTVGTDNYGWFWTLEDTAVEIVTEEEEAPRYFNLNGLEVKNPQGGIFIELKNGKTRKVVK